MRCTVLLLCVALLAMLIAGCATAPEMPSPKDFGALGPRSGDATSGGAKVQIPIAAAVNVSPAGSARSWAPNTDIGAKSDNSVAGHLITAIVLGMTPAQIQEVRKDPVLVALSARLLSASEDEDLSEFRTLCDEYVKHRELAMAGVRSEASASFPTLKNIIIAGCNISGNAGADERALTDEEAKAIGKALEEVDNILDEKSAVEGVIGG